MNQTIRILIVDDQQPARNGLKALLILYPEFEVIGLARDGREAVQMAEDQQPDVILMDAHMPTMNGLEATQLIKKKWPMIKVIVLSTCFGNKGEALAAGADSHLLKGFEPETLYKHILEILDESVRNSPVMPGIS